MKYAIILTVIILIGLGQKINEPVAPISLEYTENVSLEININASTTQVWNTITNPEYAKTLGSVFDESAFMESDWQLGSDVHFKYGQDTIVATGTISKLVEEELIHIDYDFDGFEYTEQFTLAEQNSGSSLQLFAGPYVENYDAHKTVWGNWLQKVKELSETE